VDLLAPTLVVFLGTGVLYILPAAGRSAIRFQAERQRQTLVDAVWSGRIPANHPRVRDLIEWFDKVSLTGRLPLEARPVHQIVPDSVFGTASHMYATQPMTRDCRRILDAADWKRQEITMDYRTAWLPFRWNWEQGPALPPKAKHDERPDLTRVTVAPGFAAGGLEQSPRSVTSPRNMVDLSDTSMGQRRQRRARS
jgi:hypothetical protein